MKTKKLTFRREKAETGLSAVGFPYASVEIKRNKRVVGRISAPNWQTRDSKWGVGFVVVQPDPENCGFAWVFLKLRHDTEALAREWVLRHQDAIQSKYDLYEMESQ